jgi:hypothetical protein
VRPGTWRKSLGRLAAPCWVGIALLTMALGSGCSRAERAAGLTSTVDAGRPFDVETMAFLSKARAIHHEANLREEEGDPRGAAAQVARIVGANRPHREQVVPEIEEVLADAWARLAELDVRIGDVRGAEDAAREGLTHAHEPTYFRGHLLEVQGIAEEARAAVLADAGDDPGAEKARATAMRLLEEAVLVQDQVIADALDAGRGDP